MDKNDFSTHFFEGMLDSSAGNGIIVSCPTKESAKKLADILAAHGIRFYTCSAPDGLKFWDVYKQETCYFICDKDLLYGTKKAASMDRVYSSYIKCTFYDGRDPDIQDYRGAEQDIMDVLCGDI